MHMPAEPFVIIRFRSDETIDPLYYLSISYKYSTDAASFILVDLFSAKEDVSDAKFSQFYFLLTIFMKILIRSLICSGC